MASDPLHIDFVCTGNICRSPMAEVIVRDKLERTGLGDRVRVSSSGIGGWHVGNPADERALQELEANGYDGSRHRAQQFGAAQQGADLLIALDPRHVSELVASGVDEDKIRLIRSFDPASPEGAGVEDPYYGGMEGFTTTREQIEASADGIIEWVRDQLD
ncbi:low molecular weight phosphotyrosine protein phosphatase [Corynebacterium sanguinis]|uniref:protein-tyrosine-phosphatase n=1 Tax=Corynebacterium sanguinis TaxID=2594913 RepID=A0A6C1TZ55_9CORY|nr:low molecular weight protein-tyrosine-phosphatase [Corynebacterium sanguinis]MCT1411950.1 low molecular weight phosphotyrosine protein phosphatase [Corynebacterium sanguinis]MCT1413283.1 low molecular weight phosphotyrosine protein phosphatase [Corynebacterium sanguinis]MCT1462801.1 low molecular weight phosphotyrosine protein phosphatase [Corynebacterium sanguinis]MCT1491368.1 low molecular weight phosphotyrosine protein phosphatase [Corynebacterium sanguinis]MCT1613139.1 low molecular wei